VAYAARDHAAAGNGLGRINRIAPADCYFAAVVGTVVRLRQEAAELRGGTASSTQHANPTMAVPPLTHTCWHRLATGGLSRLKTQHLGTQLLAKRIERSPEPAAAKASEIHTFFAKWERILGEEIKQLNSL
jgi:hypothetical protein